MRWLVGRVKQTIDETKQLVRDPGTTLSSAALRVWRARGGGCYGLGYLIAFGALEVQTFADGLVTSASVDDFVVGHVIWYLLRVTIESFANVVQALLWPLLVLERFGGAGLAYLGIGFLVFERWLRPFIERAFPDLRPDRGASEPSDQR